jgi:hypothetical protein
MRFQRAVHIDCGLPEAFEAVKADPWFRDHLLEGVLLESARRPVRLGKIRSVLRPGKQLWRRISRTRADSRAYSVRQSGFGMLKWRDSRRQAALYLYPVSDGTELVVSIETGRRWDLREKLLHTRVRFLDQFMSTAQMRLQHCRSPVADGEAQISGAEARLDEGSLAFVQKKRAADGRP